MEWYESRLVGGKLEILGLPPDSAHLVKVSDFYAQRLGDLTLHDSDLRFALECLDTLSNNSLSPPIAREAMWRCAIVHYAKCFGTSGARFQLSAQKILGSADPLALQAHEYFISLRNKHLVHDENAYSTALVGAAINDGNKPYNVERVVAIALHGATLENDNFSNLHLLVTMCLAWIEEQSNQLCDQISKEYDSRQHAELLKLGAPQYTVPGPAEIGHSRPRLTTRK